MTRKDSEPDGPSFVWEMRGAEGGWVKIVEIASFFRRWTKLSAREDAVAWRPEARLVRGSERGGQWTWKNPEPDGPRFAWGMRGAEAGWGKIVEIASFFRRWTKLSAREDAVAWRTEAGLVRGSERDGQWTWKNPEPDGPRFAWGMRGAEGGWVKLVEIASFSRRWTKLSARVDAVAWRTEAGLVRGSERDGQWTWKNPEPDGPRFAWGMRGDEGGWVKIVEIASFSRRWTHEYANFVYGDFAGRDLA